MCIRDRLLLLFLFLKPGEKVYVQEIFADTEPMRRRPLITYTLLFFLCLGCVLHIICWQAVLAIVIVVLLFTDRELIRQADYGLLATFVFFFIFIGNMGRLPVIVGLLRTVDVYKRQVKKSPYRTKRDGAAIQL